MLAACARIGYIGNETSPTNSVDVFIEQKAIQKPYSLLGKGFLNTQFGVTSPEKIQKMAIEKAKQKGADAILISDYTIASIEAGVKTVTTDSTRQSMVTVGSPVVTSSPEFVIYFLKYGK